MFDTSTTEITTHSAASESAHGIETTQSDIQEWTAAHERTPYENMRALMRQLGSETPTSEIIRIAFRRIPGLGPGDESIVENIHEAIEREHAVSRAERWFYAQDDPPAIAIPDERTIDGDAGNTVVHEDVRAAIEHALGESERPCEDSGTVIDCTGPVGSGYRCPDCVQHGLREEAILDALLDAMDGGER